MSGQWRLRVARDQDIAELTRSGATIPQIAERLGITTRTVERARKRVGINKPCRRYTDDEVARVEAMLADGVSMKEIDRTTGRAIGSTSNRWGGRGGWTRGDGARYRMMRARLEAL